MSLIMSLYEPETLRYQIQWTQCSSTEQHVDWTVLRGLLGIIKTDHRDLSNLPNQ